MLIATNAYINKLEKAQINNLALNMRAQGKKEQTKPSISKQSKVIKIRVKISEIEIEKRIQRINKIVNSFFEKIKNINIPLAKITKRKE